MGDVIVIVPSFAPKQVTSGFLQGGSQGCRFGDPERTVQCYNAGSLSCIPDLYIVEAGGKGNIVTR